MFIYVHIYVHVPPLRCCPVSQELSDDWLWNKLVSWDAEGNSTCCDTRQDYKGILANHAYTLLRTPLGNAEAFRPPEPPL